MVEWTNNDCQACKLMKQPIKELNERLKEAMGYEPIKEMNASFYQDEANKAKVMSFPTFDLVVNGKVTDRMTGTVSIRDLQHKIVEAYMKHKASENEKEKK